MITSLQPDDIAGIQTLYGQPGAGGAGSLERAERSLRWANPGEPGVGTIELNGLGAGRGAARGGGNPEAGGGGV